VGLKPPGDKLAHDECHMDYLAAPPEWGRWGLGTRLLRQAQAYARCQGNQRRIPDVSLHRADAWRLYKGFGFRHVLQRRSLASGRFINVPLWLYMQKHLP
jgi:ribosomal protein S18 acetylase RimI-like enzyme